MSHLGRIGDSSENICSFLYVKLGKREGWLEAGTGLVHYELM